MNENVKLLDFKNKKIHLNITFFLWIFLLMFLCTQFALNGHTIFAHATYVLFIGTAGVLILMKHRLKLYYSDYFTTVIVFMAYNFILTAVGGAVYSNIAFSRLVYMAVNLVFYIILYNFIIENENRELLLKLAVWAAVLSLIFIMINVEDIWTGRLGHSMTSDEPSFLVYGIPVYMSGNSISTFTSIGALFSLYFLGIHKKKIYLVAYIYLAFGTMLSGSRKGLLLLVLFTVFAICSFFKGANLSKLVKIVIGMIILYYLAMKVPAFYKLIGKRTELLIAAILGQDVQESSMDSRMYLAKLARSYIYDKPIFGWGLGNFSALAKSKYSVDNNYLDILVSCGIFGIFIYYYYVVIAIKNLIMLRRHKIVSMLTKTMFFVLLCFLILDLGSVTFYTRGQLMWVVVFFAFAALDLKNRDKCTD